MDNNEIENITSNLIYELDIEKCFRPQIKGLVKNIWPRRNCTYRHICNIVNGSKVWKEQ